MKLLKLHVDGVPLFSNNSFTLDLYAQDRVPLLEGSTEPNDVFRLEKIGNTYSQNIIGLSGVNASGKTTVLNILKLVLMMFAENATFRAFSSSTVQRIGKIDDKLHIQAIFWEEPNYYLIESTIQLSQDSGEGDGRFDYNSLVFVDETLWKYESSRMTRKSLASVDQFKEESKVVLRRKGESSDETVLTEDAKRFLKDNTSIVMAVHNVDAVVVESRNRELPEASFSTAIVQAFDSSIEQLDWDEESGVYKLKFKDEPLRTVSPEVAKAILSRGTVEGTELVTHAIEILKNGGYLVIDEIEEGLNRSLVAAVLDLFASPVTNPCGAQIVFSTHYPQLLDSIHRKDNVYVLVRDNECKSELIKLSAKVQRIERKKSEIILSNLIKGSTPRYPDVQAMREYVKVCVNG